MSGLNQRFTKPSSLNRLREFESHRLRNDPQECLTTFEWIIIEVRREIRRAQADEPSRGRGNPEHGIICDRISPPLQVSIRFYVLCLLYN